MKQTKEQKRTLSLLTLICGILPWILVWILVNDLRELIFIGSPLFLLCAIFSMIFGHRAKRKEGKNGTRLMGLVIGYINLSIGIIFSPGVFFMLVMIFLT